MLDITKEKLRERKRQLEEELDEIEHKLGFADPTPWGGYEWKERAIACIAQRNRYLTTVEIMRCLMAERKYNRLDPETRDKLIANLSAVLTGLVKSGYIGSVKIPGMNKGYFFGLVGWFENGKLKEEHASSHIKPVLETINSKLTATN